MPGPNNSRGRREQRKREAIERNKKWAALSNQEKLNALIERGHGHCKQAETLKVALGELTQSEVVA